MTQQNLINHVAFVLDASSSMRGKERDVISVFDGQIAWLAKRSKELDQETRVTVYVFASGVECVIFDKDVMRLPSIRDFYRTSGNTALRDATIQSQEELAQTFTKYGSHAFLTFVLTDGEENVSRSKPAALVDLLARQDDRWTLAALVPNSHGRISCIDAGFPRGNVEVWDTNSVTGVAEVGEVIRGATETYMVNRTMGTNSSKTLFAGSAQQVNQQTVSAAGLTALDPDQFFLIPVAASTMAPMLRSGKPTKAHPEGLACVEIMKMVESTGRRYEIGKGFYQLVKSEKVAGNKRIAVVDRSTSKVYLGKAARQLIGLSDVDQRVRPMPKDSSGAPPFEIYIESQSVNRHLPIGTRILLLK